MSKSSQAPQFTRGVFCWRHSRATRRDDAHIITLANAKQWRDVTDKAVFISDLLGQFSIEELSDKRLQVIEDAFESLLAAEPAQAEAPQIDDEMVGEMFAVMLGLEESN